MKTKVAQDSDLNYVINFDNSVNYADDVNYVIEKDIEMDVDPEGLDIPVSELSSWDENQAIDGELIFRDNLDYVPEESDEVVLEDAHCADDLELSEEVLMDESDDLDFTVPLIPGADDDVSFADDEEEEVVVVSANPWDWKSRGLSEFTKWLHEMINAVPRHSGGDTTGVERALAHFEALDKAITQAMREDFKGEIDAAKAEKARVQIQEGMKRLIDRLKTLQKKKFNKKASIVKEAKQEKITGITVTVPLLISRIARTLINGTVSAGHNMERMFEKLASDYELTKRERAEVAQLLEDMGYLYPGQLDRGFAIGETDSKASSDNYDLAAMYPG